MLGFDSWRPTNSNEKEKELRQLKVSYTESDVNNTSPPKWGAHVGLFIGELNSLITMP
jgi:hypothetical protein